MFFTYTLAISSFFCFLNKTPLLHCKLPYLKCGIFTQFITQLKQLLAYRFMGEIYTTLEKLIRTILNKKQNESNLEATRLSVALQYLLDKNL